MIDNGEGTTRERSEVFAWARGRDGCPVRSGIWNSWSKHVESTLMINPSPLKSRGEFAFAIGRKGIARIRNDEKHQRTPDRQRATCNFVGRANVETFADLRGRYMTEYPRHLKKIERARSRREGGGRESERAYSRARCNRQPGDAKVLLKAAGKPRNN